VASRPATLEGKAQPTGVAPVVQIHPSRRCNLACAHCYSSSSPTERGELHLDLLLACLEDAVKLGYRQLAVSGGEPLLYQPLAELLAGARELGMLTSITSNGMLATPRRWLPLASLIDVAAISIDGRPDEHDAIRRKDGAFLKTAANLDVIRRSGVPFGFIFTLTQYNADSLDFVIRLAATSGARSVQVHPLTLDGRAATALPDARPDAIELTAGLYEAARLGDELGVAVHVDTLTLEQLVGYRDHLVPNQPVASLVDVAPVLVVEADASVMPLTHGVSRVLQLGSLTEGPLSSLARNWLAVGHGDKLAGACERAWSEIACIQPRPAVYWYDAVAEQTRNPTPLQRSPDYVAVRRDEAMPAGSTLSI
jgi:Fe-coproporphyrin III synthase